MLRGLSFDETGALLAAPTTSLPEEIGGVRNWDYRFTWHRDAALLLLALFRLGHAEEGRRYLHFLLENCAGASDVLSPLVGIHGVTPEEEILDHLDGYAGSRPVRIGNDAAHQLQFDTYGHVLDAALLYQQLTGELTGAQWRLLRRHVDTMAARWREPDHGIWEIRGPLPALRQLEGDGLGLPRPGCPPRRPARRPRRPVERWRRTATPSTPR